MRKILLVALAMTCCTPAFALYKCEVNGQTTYSDTLCPGGKLVDNIPESSSAADANHAQRQLAQQKNDAQQLANQRHKREAIEEKQQQRNARTNVAKQKKCAASALHKKWAEEDAAKATGKASPKALQKARRAAEKHALECEK